MTIGMRSTLLALEVLLGKEIPGWLRCDPCFKSAVECAIELVGLGNDLIGLGKDLAHFSKESSPAAASTSKKTTWPNIVLAYKAQEECSLEDAINYFIDRHASLVAIFDAQVETFLAERCPLDDQEVLRAYFYHVRYCVFGFNLWHSTTPRYTTHPIETDSGTIKFTVAA